MNALENSKVDKYIIILQCYAEMCNNDNDTHLPFTIFILVMNM